MKWGKNLSSKKYWILHLNSLFFSYSRFPFPYDYLLRLTQFAFCFFFLHSQLQLIFFLAFVGNLGFISPQIWVGAHNRWWLERGFAEFQMTSDLQLFTFLLISPSSVTGSVLQKSRDLHQLLSLSGIDSRKRINTNFQT